MMEGSSPAGKVRRSFGPPIMSYLTLRRLIGWIATLLPIVLVVANVFFHKDFKIYISRGAFIITEWPDSASGYYYTGLRDVFVGSLCALGVFLLAYRGYEKADIWITNIAGFCAIGVALFPTKPSINATHAQDVVGFIHDVVAVSLIFLMGIMALRFAKSAHPDQNKYVRVWFGFGNMWPPNSPRIRRKKRRNVVYRTSGGVTLLCAVIFLIQPLSAFNTIKKDLPFIYLVETAAIFAFGIAWFVKGRSLLPLRRRRILKTQTPEGADASRAAENGRNAQEKVDTLTAAAAVPTEEAVTQLLGGGRSAKNAADELGISRQRVCEVAADII